MNDARLGFQKSAAPAALKFPPASIHMKFELIGQQIQLRSNKDALQLHVNFQRAYEIAPSFISALRGAGTQCCSRSNPTLPERGSARISRTTSSPLFCTLRQSWELSRMTLSSFCGAVRLMNLRSSKHDLPLPENQ